MIKAILSPLKLSDVEESSRQIPHDFMSGVDGYLLTHLVIEFLTNIYNTHIPSEREETTTMWDPFEVLESLPSQEQL